MDKSRCAVVVLLVAACVPRPAAAQARSDAPATVAAAMSALPAPEPAVVPVVRRQNDPLLNGLLIGTAVGAGFLLLGPPAMCEDAECTANVRGYLALPALGMGALVGVLVDARHEQGPLGWQGKSGRWKARLDPVMLPRGGGARLTVDFRPR